MRTVKLMFLVLCAGTLAVSCDKKEEQPPVAEDNSYLIEGNWTERLRVVKTSTDTSAHSDSTANIRGTFVSNYQGGTVKLYQLSKLQSTRKYNFDGSALVIYDTSPTQGNAENYTATFGSNTMNLYRKRITSNGVYYTTEETTVYLEKY